MKSAPSEALANESLQRIRNVLHRMSNKLRDAFVLLDIDGMSARDAAQLLGISHNTMRSRHSLAREEFKRLWHSETHAHPLFGIGNGPRARRESVLALSRLQAFRSKWPQSAIGQEVDLRVVVALLALGHRHDAANAASRFMLRYPGSVHATEIRRLAEESSRPGLFED